MIRNKILALVTAGCLTVSLGVTTLAYTKNVTSKTKVNYSKVQTEMPANSQNNIKSKLDALVKAGTITQTIEDKVITSFNQMDASRKAEMDKIKTMTEAQRKTYMDSQTKTQKIDPLSSLVTDGTLTQAQADAIKAALPHGGRPQGFPGGEMGHRQGMGRSRMDNQNSTAMGTMMKSKLDALVKAGTITQTVEDKVTAYAAQQETARKAEMDKIKSMSAAERKTYLESQVKTQKTDMFANMVTSGTLTQAEADVLKTALMQEKSVDMQSMLKTKLDTLVTNGTITQTIEDKVIATYNQIETDRKAEMDKLKTMTEAQRKTYMDSQASAKRTNPLAALVTNGTLTQAQADAINKLLPDNHGGPGGHGGPMGFRGHGGRH